MAGLAASVAAARACVPVTLFEATGHAGGRCRSFFDAGLGAVIDNGTHLVLNANRHVLDFAQAVGGACAMTRGPALFPFIDLETGRRWTLTPFSLLRHPLDLARALGLLGGGPDATVAQVMGRAKAYHTLWDPLSVATLNTASDQASARQFARMMRVAVTMGLGALKPWTFPRGLSAALVEPAVATLKDAGGIVRYNHRLKAIGPAELQFDGHSVPLTADDQVILALPPWATRDFFPALPAMKTEAIVNAHFRLDRAAAFDHGLTWMGATSGLSQWISIRGDIVSVTVSAANEAAELPNDQLGRRIWGEIAPLLGAAGAPCPAYRIIRERRATIAHTPAQVALRPQPTQVATQAGGVIKLAADWLDNPLPCTIEAAVASGLRAAKIALGRPNLRFMS
jgi:hypothetical protein